MEGVAPPFAAVLFDLDGVLRNTEPYHRMAYAQLARSLSGGAPPDAGEIAGKSNLQLYEALVARFGGPATAEELSQRHFRLVCQMLEEYRVGPMPGREAVRRALEALESGLTPDAVLTDAEEALDALRRRGIPFGVVSSSWRWYVEHCLRGLGMYEDAAVIVTGSDGLPLKPAPAPYQAAARVFRPAPPGAVLAVEDSGSGVRSAVAAGLACAAVYNPDSGAQDLSPARWRLNSLYELPALLDGN